MEGSSGGGVGIELLAVNVSEKLGIIGVSIDLQETAIMSVMSE